MIDKFDNTPAAAIEVNITETKLSETYEDWLETANKTNQRIEETCKKVGNRTELCNFRLLWTRIDDVARSMEVF